MKERDFNEVADTLCMDENAFFALLEQGPCILEYIRRRIPAESDSGIRSGLVEIAWQTRDLAALDILAEALRDPIEEVWKQALDGLVCLGTPESRKILEAALHSNNPKAGIPIDWIEEALDQIRDNDV